MLTIFGDEVPLRARVEVINGYSAHADRMELASWIDRVREQSSGLSSVWLVHGEPPAQDELATTLRAKGFTVGCPSPQERQAF
jgi:metallo-beta-lactamase family protein